MRLMLCREYTVLIAIQSIQRNDAADYLVLCCQTLDGCQETKTTSDLIDADEGLGQADVVAENAAAEKYCRLLYVVFVIDGEGFLVAFLVVANPENVT